MGYNNQHLVADALMIMDDATKRELAIKPPTKEGKPPSGLTPFDMALLNTIAYFQHDVDNEHPEGTTSCWIGVDKMCEASKMRQTAYFSSIKYLQAANLVFRDKVKFVRGKKFVNPELNYKRLAELQFRSRKFRQSLKETDGIPEETTTSPNEETTSPNEYIHNKKDNNQKNNNNNSGVVAVAVDESDLIVKHYATELRKLLKHSILSTGIKKSMLGKHPGLLTQKAREVFLSVTDDELDDPTSPIVGRFINAFKDVEFEDDPSKTTIMYAKTLFSAKLIKMDEFGADVFFSRGFMGSLEAMAEHGAKRLKEEEKKANPAITDAELDEHYNQHLKELKVCRDKGENVAYVKQKIAKIKAANPN